MTTSELHHLYPDWHLVRPLGEGAFGKVYEIRRGEGDLEEHAALKVIHIPQSESEIKLLQSEGADVSAHFEELARQLSKEIATQAKLKGNSNIVSYEDRRIVPDADGLGQTILIRMELLTPLVDLMAAGAMGQAEVLQLGLDMARALLLCERFHIIHRDIKPQNIFISPAGDYKLGDFGVARQLEQTTANLSRKGTYNYMAPEVFHGRPCNATVDIYSLGIVLYTLLNGNRAPFLPSSVTGTTVTNHDRESAQTKRLSGEPLPPLPHIPAALNEVILRMCAFESKERYQSAHELVAALENVTLELQGDKTVSLRSWIGDNTPSVAPPMDATMEDEGSRWIDGTPVVNEKTPGPAPGPVPEPGLQPAPKKSPGKALVAVLVGVVVVLAGVVAWVAMRGSPGLVPNTVTDNLHDNLFSEPTNTMENGDTESSAKVAAEGLVSAYKWKATNPLLVNISGQPTYFLSLMDNSGVVQGYSMVNVAQYNKIKVWGKTMDDCTNLYLQALKDNKLPGTESLSDIDYELALLEFEQAIVISPDSATTTQSVTTSDSTRISSNNAFVNGIAINSKDVALSAFNAAVAKVINYRAGFSKSHLATYGGWVFNQALLASIPSMGGLIDSASMISDSLNTALGKGMRTETTPKGNSNTLIKSSTLTMADLKDIAYSSNTGGGWIITILVRDGSTRQEKRPFSSGMSGNSPVDKGPLNMTGDVYDHMTADIIFSKVQSSLSFPFFDAEPIDVSESTSQVKFVAKLDSEGKMIELKAVYNQAINLMELHNLNSMESYKNNTGTSAVTVTYDAFVY